MKEWLSHRQKRTTKSVPGEMNVYYEPEIIVYRNDPYHPENARCPIALDSKVSMGYSWFTVHGNFGSAVYTINDLGSK